MNFLFFDLEFASSSRGVNKICEFGYVLVDEKFEVIKRGVFIINPNISRKEWDWYVLKKILTRPITKYEESQTFDKFYEDIEKIIKSANYIFGHTLYSDAKALNDDCKRYNLKSIDFIFYDVKKIYKEYNNSKRDLSVNDILNKLKIKGEEKIHDAESDAYNTMLELKHMLKELEISVKDLIQLCPEVMDENKNYEVMSLLKIKKNKEKMKKEVLEGEGNNFLKSRARKEMFLEFINNVLPQKGYKQKLNGLKFSISLNYEQQNYRQMLNIVQILCNYGANYVTKASLSDVFVNYESNVKSEVETCSRFKSVKEANENGANIKIISFNELMEKLEISEKKLNEMPMVSFKCLLNKEAKIKSTRIKKLLKIKKGKSDTNIDKNEKFKIKDIYPNLNKKD